MMRKPRPKATTRAAASPETAPARGTTLEAYRAKRDFSATTEPPPPGSRRRKRAAPADAAIFVVQKHAARRLHYDFRLEHGGVLWSWAVPKGPSLDPRDKRLAVRVEDHPRDYANFAGTIPKGNYGAGEVEIWDHGTWTPVGDPAADLAAGELKFTLAGERLNGGFVLVRLKPRPKDKSENWLLIKEHDDDEQAGASVDALEAAKPKPARRRAAAKPPKPNASATEKSRPGSLKDLPGGACRAALPRAQAPELATLAERPPGGDGWIVEIKFDGYRLMAWVRSGEVRLLTRNGQDWTTRLPHIAQAVAALRLDNAILDGELVALRKDGVSSFADLQAALSAERDEALVYYVFDLLYLGAYDLRGCALTERKRLLRELSDWRGTLRYSDHILDAGEGLQDAACAMGVEGIICKRADRPYRGGRLQDWIKVKCAGREEFIVLGWTDPAGTRKGFGALHLGFYDPGGALNYAGAVGTGFSGPALSNIGARLQELAAPAQKGLRKTGEPLPRDIHWLRPELVGEIRYSGWSGGGRLRHASWLGLREDKPAREVIRDLPAPDATARDQPPAHTAGSAVSSRARAAATAITVHAKRDGADRFDGVRLTHPDKELWPGITKRDLAVYWRAVAERALPGIAPRPLAVLRCPDGIDGQHFFQKHVVKGTAGQFRGGESGGAPWLAIDGVDGLYAAAQMAAIELHGWGATLDDPLRPDRLVFDLDPGEGVAMAQIAAAARDVRERLHQAGLASWCRSSGGKGLHVVAPLRPRADWETARAWCRRLAEAMAGDAPDRYVSVVAKKQREGRILIDWLRNGLGATAICSFSPRARPGATVAMPLAWREVTAKLDPSAYTIATVPGRLAAQRTDPWADFAAAARPLPDLSGGAR